MISSKAAGQCSSLSVFVTGMILVLLALRFVGTARADVQDDVKFTQAVRQAWERELLERGSLDPPIILGIAITVANSMKLAGADFERLVGRFRGNSNSLSLPDPRDPLIAAARVDDFLRTIGMWEPYCKHPLMFYQALLGGAFVHSRDGGPTTGKLTASLLFRTRLVDWGRSVVQTWRDPSARERAFLDLIVDAQFLTNEPLLDTTGTDFIESVSSSRLSFAPYGAKSQLFWDRATLGLIARFDIASKESTVERREYSCRYFAQGVDHVRTTLHRKFIRAGRIHLLHMRMPGRA